MWLVWLLNTGNEGMMVSVNFIASPRLVLKRITVHKISSKLVSPKIQ